MRQGQRSKPKEKLFAGWRGADFALPAFIFFALVLGGATAEGAFANLTLQLAAIAIIAVYLARRAIDPDAAPIPLALKILISVAFGWPLLQLIPLPPGLWHALPGRGTIAANDALLGMPSVWRPISYQPNQTIADLFAMLVPLAAFVLARHASDKGRWAAIGTIMVVALISSLLGIVQIAQGPGGQAYFYDVTNDNTSVGFFSNSNHLSTLFLVAAACALTFPPNPTGESGKSVLAMRVVRIALLAFFLLNVALNRSLAGSAIALLFVAYAALRATLTLPLRWRTIAIAVGAVFFAGIVGFLVSAPGRALVDAVTLNSTDPSIRLTFYHNTVAMFRETFPFGSGLGSFRWAYAGHERMQAVTNVYANHAHSDYLELASDLGVIGPLLLIGFAGWFVVTIVRGRGLPRYAETAAVAIVMVALHSIVDYPARTAALASVVGLCVALMLRWPVPPPAPPATLD